MALLFLVYVLMSYLHMLKIRFVPLILSICLLLSLAACGVFNHKNRRYRQTRLLMGTVVHVDICATNNIDDRDVQQAYRDVWARLEDISLRMNAADPKSDIGRLNSAFPSKTKVGKDTYSVIKDAVYFSKLTDGAFDITVRPLIELWKQCQIQQRIPSQDEIKAVLNSVGASKIQFLSGNNLRLTDTNVKLDLGGIAKGYGVDEAARILRRHGIYNFFIDAGGDIYAGGCNCNGHHWRIGIRDPEREDGIVDVLSISNIAVTTSGNYEQFYKIGEKRFSHIINPITGYPQQGVISATVIAPTAESADALSTALCVLGSDAAIALIDSLKDGSYAALIISKQEDGEVNIKQSSKYEKYRAEK